MIVPQNPTYAYIGAFVDELARAGMRDVVICPGSRSTPLTLTFAAEERIRKWVLVDERSAAFFALGIAKASGNAVTLVCTSGTAAANFFPAIAEAQQSHSPLLILTTDRPPELQEVGAPQTMGQQNLYGEHVKWFTNMALPEANETMLRYVRTMGNRAVVTAEATPHGPVHLNFPFREPLSNTPILASTLPLSSERQGIVWHGRETPAFREPFTEVAHQYSRARDEIVEEIAERIKKLERGLVIAGPTSRKWSYDAPRRLAQSLGWPLLVDPLSGGRFGAFWHSDVITNYDAFLRDPNFVKQNRVEVIIRFGAMPTSKPLLQYLETYPDALQIIVGDTNQWLNPTLNTFAFLFGDEHQVTQQLREQLATPSEASLWYKHWGSIAQATSTILTSTIEDYNDLFEGRVFMELQTLLPEDSHLVIGNSMPIRDCDTFLWGSAKNITVLGNRGVNGIDGMVSTALGVSVTRHKPTVLVVGDLTFYHDLNGLLAAKKYGLNLTIVVINNDGGGIFPFLPQAEHHPDHFEEYFGTPTGLDFSLVTAMYGGTFTRIENWNDFRAAVTRGITEGGLHVVEVPTNRESNVAMHRHLWKKVSEALAESRKQKADE